MKKRGKKLLLMAVVLLALTGGSLLAMKLNPENEITESTEENEITSEKIMDFQRSDVETLSWTMGEESHSFHLENDIWISDEDPDFPADQNTLTSLVSRMIDLSSYNVVENVSDLSEYGLDEPSCSINLGGSVDIQVLMGDPTPMDSLRYVSIGDGNVYMVESSLIYEYDVSLLDLMEQDEIPNMSDLHTVEINTADSQLIIERREVVIPAESDEVQDTTEKQWYSITADSETLLDESLASSFYSNINALSWSGNVAYNVSEEDMSLYGLDNPAAQLTVCFNNSDGVLDVFNAQFSSAEDGSCYGRVEGSDRVYSINSNYLNNLLNTSTESLLPAPEETPAE